jgi:hypothetical protein
MTEELSQTSFDEILRGMRRSITLLQQESEYYQNQNTEIALKNLRRVTALIGDKPISIPKVISALFKQQWQDFVNGARAVLDKKAVRYLCAEPLIALDPLFLSYIDKSGMTLGAQAIHALVRSCHMKWIDESLNDHAISIIRGFVKDYNGPNRIVRKWKEKIRLILYTDATSKFSQEILDKKEALEKLFQAWGIDVQSGFAAAAVNKTCTSCRRMIGSNSHHNDYYLKELLAWDKWHQTLFRAEIEAAILDTNIGAIQEKFQAVVLGDKRLGDPRLPRNANWLGFKEEAKRKFISWLSRRDIIFFFEHVLPSGKDPHGRKDFWLKYVNSLSASRPLLCEQDRHSLRAQLQREQIDHGLISGMNSAFILDFGTVVAVEFSKVGACYIYLRDNFKKIIQNLFDNKWFSEGDLKRIDLAIEKNKIVHRLTVNCDWRNDVAMLLARYGIRKK